MRWRLRHLAPLALETAVLALLAALPSTASAQRAGTPYRVGVLTDARGANHPALDGLRAGLRDLGLEEGRDVIFDVRLTDANPERMPAAAAALAKAGVDVIFTSGEAATRAARAATPTSPIVFTLVGDPVAAGFVKTLAQPGGNLTGVSSLTADLVVKRVEALKTLAPGLRRVWAISPDGDPAASAAIARAQEISSRFGIEIVFRTIRTLDELERVLESLRPGDALLVPDIAAMDLSAILLETSLARRIPAVFTSELWVSHGGLVSYGADYRAQGVQAARLVSKILRGARPGDLPVEGPERIVLAINLKTAASLGLTAPRQMLFQADIIRR
jgi:putative ABC transport system substrate-binding protein